jgi:murein L,D-transpeptidase YafK
MKNLLLLLFVGSFAFADGFKAHQLTHERVKAAYREKYAPLEKQLQAKGLSFQQLELYLRAFKHEKEVEVWARTSSAKPFTLFTTYPVCARSGTYGPKRQEGDGQIPEGFYFIDRFNPKSNYYLSLGINYPNAADSARHQGKLGGNIFLHGDCVTLGCLPLTDEKMKELYVLTVEAHHQGQQQIPVHIFPTRFNAANYTQLKQTYARQPDLLAFWENLAVGFHQFEQTRFLPKVQVTTAGQYAFQ